MPAVLVQPPQVKLSHSLMTPWLSSYRGTSTSPALAVALHTEPVQLHVPEQVCSNRSRPKMASP
jgi:hypothetical protein